MQTGDGEPARDSSTQVEGIAVVGVAFKFPQDAITEDAFWQLLMEKRCTMTEWPQDRLNVDSYHSTSREEISSIAARGGNFLKEDPAAFDASFFSIAPTEAATLDPQQRLALETTYTALENAGIPLDKVRQSRTGVYMGSMCHDWNSLIDKDIEGIPKYAATGIADSMLSNRVSWFFDLVGPSITVNSACSSSLLALHLACQSLRAGEIDMAIVGGVNVLLGVEPSICMTQMGFLSPDSRCYSFDHRANGYARGEGIGVVVLKRTSGAVAHNDTVRAFIRATGSNQDGHTPGITQPRLERQAQLMQETYQKAGLSLSSTLFCEAHGTGTPVGDPIEANAIGTVFNSCRSSYSRLLVGAVKSNIGHLEGASGIAGLIKSLLVLEKGIIPPNANFERVSPSINFKELGLEFPDAALPWPTKGLRRLSINSFGFGGTNAHAVLDDADHFLSQHHLSVNHVTASCARESHSRKNGVCTLSIQTNGLIGHTNDARRGKANGHASEDERMRNLIVWSAADESAAHRMVEAYCAHFSGLHSPPDGYYHDLIYTLSCRRSFLSWRCFAVTSGVHDLKALEDRVIKFTRASTEAGVLFVFTGQGAQYPRMGLQLLHYPIFREALTRFQRALESLGCSWSLFDELRRDEPTSNLDNPAYSQPTCTAIQIAIIDLLRSFDIHPLAVIGHSSGEIAAAYATGDLSLHSACKVAYYRGVVAGSLLKSQQNGNMLAVGLAEEAITPYLEDLSMAIACINSPSNVTISGKTENLLTLKQRLDSEGVFCRLLNTGVAYHSPQMQALASRYREAIRELHSAEARAISPFMASTASGDLIRSRKVLRSPDYWVQNMTEQVRFSQALSQTLQNSSIRRSIHDIVEIGPHSTLQRPIMETLTLLKKQLPYSSALSRFSSSSSPLIETVGRLFCSGHAVNLEQVNRLEPSHTSQYKCLTDLPKYSFSRTKRYWSESAYSQSTRLRPHFPLPFLGAPVPGWNPLQPRWRKYLSLKAYPWLEDHKINGIILFPAAGMVAIALAAVNQMAQKDMELRGFHIKEATFLSPIPIATAEEQTTEIETTLHTTSNGMERSQFWSEVVVHVRIGDTWREACHTILRAQYQSSDKGLDKGKEDKLRLQNLLQDHDVVSGRCLRNIKTESLYRIFDTLEHEYGTTFRPLHVMAWDGASSAVGLLAAEPLQAELAGKFRTLNPAVLDGLLQLAWAPLTKGGTELAPSALPSALRNTWISNALLDNSASVLSASMTASITGLKIRMQNAVLVDSDQTVMMTIEHAELAISSTKGFDSDPRNSKKICFQMDTKPDVDLLTQHQLQMLCQPNETYRNIDTKFSDELAYVIKHSCIEALKKLSGDDVEHASTHMKEYVDWMRHHVASGAEAVSTVNDVDTRTASSLEMIYDNVERASTIGKLAVAVGKHLSDIILGKMSLADIFPQADLTELYDNEVAESLRHPILTLMEALGHKHPDMKILEVGAGSGTITEVILSPLLVDSGGHPAGAKFQLYEITSSSKAFFPELKQRFKSLHKSGKVVFRQLHAEVDLAAQGFQTGSYDLIVASLPHVMVHEVKEILQNLRKLFKPKGKLILRNESKGTQLWAKFISGCLPERWATTRRSTTVDQLDSSLLESGFSGIDTRVGKNFILSTATEESQLSYDIPTNTLIILDPASKIQKDVASELEAHLQSKGQHAWTSMLGDFDASKWDPMIRVIFLLEIDQPFLRRLCERDFNMIKIVLSRGMGYLWVTRGDTASGQYPDLSMVDGLARVLRSENSNKPFATLALEATNTVENSVSIIASIVDSVSRNRSRSDMEFVMQNGVAHIRRVVDASQLDIAIKAKIVPKERIRALGDAGALSLKVASPGMLDSLHFVTEMDPETNLLANEVEIDVLAWGLNFKDVLVALGRVEDELLGLEFAGVVRRSGSGESLKPGDRVFAGALGSFKTRVICSEVLALKIPEEMSDVEAAALPTIGATAYYSLVEVGRLEKGETVLIHAGAGATGQMCICLAQHLQAEVFATVSSYEKKELLINEYGLPEDHIFYSRDTSFAQGIRRVTGGRGVDIVVNSLSGESLIASWEVIAPFGRFIEIGKGDIIANSKLPMNKFDKNVSFTAVAIDHIVAHRPALLRHMLQKVTDMVSSGQLRLPYPLHTFPISSIEEAFRLLQHGKTKGKIVLTADATNMVKTQSVLRSPYRLRDDATYVIAGGLGGIGRSLAKWMVSKGAKNLLLLSRSGPVSTTSRELVSDLQSRGILVEAPSCDVASAEQFLEVMEQYRETMPTIRGCIQCTMVLRDALFENMSYSDWDETVRSKVETTWNLHKYLPSGMDFFIILSSISGIIGAVGQANYAAGNTYQDALAGYRRAIGEHAISLDLGIMADVGIVAENNTFVRQRELGASGHQVEEQELHAILDYYCDPELSCRGVNRAQIIVGLPVSSLLPEPGVSHSQGPTQRILSALVSTASSNVPSNPDSKSNEEDYTSLFTAAASKPDAEAVVLRGLVSRLCKSLSIPSEEFEVQQPLHHHGVDSLVAVEVRTWIGKTFGANISILSIMGAPSVLAIGGMVVEVSTLR